MKVPKIDTKKNPKRCASVFLLKKEVNVYFLLDINAPFSICSSIHLVTFFLKTYGIARRAAIKNNNTIIKIRARDKSDKPKRRKDDFIPKESAYDFSISDLNMLKMNHAIKRAKTDKTMQCKITLRQDCTLQKAFLSLGKRARPFLPCSKL